MFDKIMFLPVQMVKVNDSDRWSLITLGNNRAKTVELKFVNNMRRQYEFSVDSFHIMLDTLFLFYECSGTTPITENFYPTVVGESMYGDFHEALYHLHKKMIATRYVGRTHIPSFPYLLNNPKAWKSTHNMQQHY